MARTNLVAIRKVNDDLTDAIYGQNIAVAAMDAKTAEAETRRDAAEQTVAGLLERSTARAAAVKASTASKCSGVLNEARDGCK